MKIKDLRTKDLGELRKMLSDINKTMPKLTLEHKMHKDKNTKKLSNIRREVATLLGMISAKALGESK